jgi:pilus assembly protein CpaE
VLTAGIVSTERSSAEQLLAGLQQTGLVGNVAIWTLPGDPLPDGSEAIPDVVFLDLPRDPGPFFVFANHTRRLRPAVRLIACSASSPPSHQLLLEAMRCGVQDFVSRPVKPEQLNEILVRFEGEGEQTVQRSGAEKLIVVMGAKGGVGTTTVAVNLGVNISAATPSRVVLLDFARPFGNAHLFLDLRPRFGLRDAVGSLERLDTHFFTSLLAQHKSKLMVLGGTMQAEEWGGIQVPPLSRVINVAQACCDTVLVDLGSQLSADWGPMLQSARMILLVVEANVPSLWTLERRLIAMAGFGVPQERVSIVVNRWHKGDDEALKGIEKNLKRPVFARLPNDFRKANTAVNLGAPMLENHNSVLGNSYRQLAMQLAGPTLRAPAPTIGGGLSSFFSTQSKR